MEKTKDQILEAAKELQARRQARQSLKDFILYTYPRYIVGKHHQLLFDTIEKILTSKKKRLMVFMPPRHGKSVIVSRRLPAFYIGKHPDKFVVMASYEESLATEFGRDLRNLVADVHFKNIFPDIEMSEDSNAAGKWNTRQGGGFYACGVGSGLTGRGADLAIIDDPVKDRAQAESPTYRKRIKDWYQSTFYTRLHPDSTVILCMTRWHHDDLAGWLLKQEGAEEWEVLNLPAFAGEKDLMGRKLGEALWPEKYPAAALDSIKRSIGPDEFQALYQGSPTAHQGKIFKKENWRYWNFNNLPDDFDSILISMDPNLKETENGSKAVVHCWGRLGQDFYLLDRAAGRWEFSEAIQIIKAFCHKHPQAAGKLFEDTAAGPAIMSTLKNIIGGIIPISPRGKSKELRARAIQPYHVAGNIIIPEPGARFPWVEEFIAACSEFPASDEADDVDTMTQTINWWMSEESNGGAYDIGWSTTMSEQQLEALERQLLPEQKKEGDMVIEKAWL